MPKLPPVFLDEIKQLLGEETGQFLAGYDRPVRSGLRINSLKVSGEQWKQISPFVCREVPWVRNGFYYSEKDNPAKDVYYYAGLYYLQEPSAMTPADRLPVDPGDRVLDLCAAPGGKATALGAKLKGRGLLMANDISVSRANALLKNIELAGIQNAVVTAETPERLAARFPEYFDKILVDAPCSGEGMFRKDPSMIKSWQEKDSSFYAPIQREILAQAAGMLKPGGLLMYSTCTFSSKENEDNIRWFLERFPAFHLKEISSYEGFSKGIYPDVNKCVRIWPHRMEGEGHFLALLKKEESASAPRSSGDPAIPATEGGCRISETDFPDFMDACAFPVSKDRLMLLKDLLYLLPEDFENPMGLRILRSGLLLGTMKNKRFTPSQAFAMAMKKSCYLNPADFDKNDLRVVKYLKGETVALDEETKGWTLVCVDGFPLGWGKASAGMLKNKYAAGWRMQ